MTTWTLAKPLESYPGFTLHLRLTAPKQNGVAERAVRRIKEGTSAVLLQSGLDEKWWADSMECYCYLRDVQDFHCRTGKHLTNGVLENHSVGQ